jgi:hypothetical protein
MNKSGLSREGLKVIACVTMLLDHIGATIVLSQLSANPSVQLQELYELLRLIGRLSFPIYCFLLAEGSFYTKHPGNYAFRLSLSALLTEIPYDLAFRGGWSWDKQNVMVTLLLAFLALEVMKKCKDPLMKLVAALPFALAAELARSDYGWEGVLLVVLFAMTRDLPWKRLIQFFGMWFLFSPDNAMALNWVNGIHVTLQEYAVLSLLPIQLYNGKKLNRSKVVQWGFYLFYPVHLLVLYCIGRL